MPSAPEASPPVARDDAAAAAGRRRLWTAVTLLWLAALGGRLLGLDYLLPHAPEPDAYVVQQALWMQAHDGAPTEGVDAVVWRKYPHLLARVLSVALPEAAALPPLEPSTLQQHLDQAARPYVLGRALSALLASLAVPLTFLLARRFVRPRVALIAAALMGTSLLHLYLSQMARPHGPVATFTLATTWLAVEWYRRPRASVAVGACVAAALAVATLHNGLAALAPLGVAWVLTLRRDGPRALLPAAGVLLAVGLALWLAYPFLGEPPLEVDSALGLDAEVVAAGHEVQLDRFGGGGFAVIGRALVDYDPVLPLLAAIGLAALVLRRGWTTEQLGRGVVVAGFGLPYLLAIGLYDFSFERFALPLWPLLAVLGAHGLASLAQGIGPRAKFALPFVVLAIPALLCARKLQLNLRPDTYERIAARVERRLDSTDGLLLAHPQGFLPLPLLERVTRERSWSGLTVLPWREHLLCYPPATDANPILVRQAPSRSELDARGWRARDGTVSPAMLQALIDQLTGVEGEWILTVDLRRGARRGGQEQALERFARLVTTESPWRDGDDSGAEVGYQGESALMRLVQGERLGPCLRLWDLP
ncbi:phospholipid carrier-dependent glycosyltransferase [Engelhardtia mirabilis]|uniref:Dolichyl-phosphate-mannose-protein mannosyltransferase n=1 Tax=Engelhardtia mirabilis TaxID=2528011 RepID=A0A518BQL5_9BACT|nr:Dolichyl-phosphate-mannose-protein mannosyltransferase [Planctomycetes bacterium Pla133]QDV03592.1 Dolichyl-phosphate-mannose-protein mannosyltransferase [Planctomycetes bacterium Pla86]